MTSSTTLAQTRKPRPGREWAAESIFRPLAQGLVDPLARVGVKPTQLVLVHTALGLLAAGLAGRGGRLTPALLLQVKTVLDNLDGQLARATGQTTETGRYLDTEMDLVVNFALFSAMAPRAGLPATVLLSLLLTADYLWERDHRAARGEVFRSAPAQGGDHPAVLGALRGVYALYFQPQEALLSRVFEARLWRAAGGEPTEQDRLAYTPPTLTQVSAQLGLSSQLLGAGLALALGRPRAYLYSLPMQAALLVGLQLWRENLVRRGRA